LERDQRAGRRGLISHAELQQAVGLSATVNGVQIVRHTVGRKLQANSPAGESPE
jgi:hypothetical protein